MANDKPIDIVYLWVDGNDPAWRLKRQSAMAALSEADRNSMAIYGNVEGRFRDNDELRYSLRALERFFPEHGHVYVVTDDQSPSWLRTSNLLTVVDHRDLIPSASLPTFDSGNIESYIHRIPNLSERYFYLNDDVFFGAPVNVSDWFRDDGIYVSWSDEPPVTDEPLRPDATSLENACRLSKQWFHSQDRHAKGADTEVSQIARRYSHIFRTFAHSPRPMLKSLIFDLEKKAPDLFSGVRSTVFRTWDKPTIISDFVMRWALAIDVAKVRDHSHLYVSTGCLDTREQLTLLISSLGSVDFFCINDTTDDAHQQDPRLAVVRETLQLLFPTVSSFESTLT